MTELGVRLADRTNMAIVHKPIAELLPYARNARTHSETQIAQISGAMVEWGWTNPVLIDETGMIIAGHGRVLAARKLKLPDVPCLVLDGLTDIQKRALVLADNKLAMNAGWDDEMLVMELGDLDGFDLDIVGFNDAEITALLHGISPGDGLTDPDDVPSVPITPVSVLGDTWILGPTHRLVCGDSTDLNAVEKALNGVKPHLMVTDIPYGVNYDPTWRTGVASSRKGVANLKRAAGKVENDDIADWRDVYALFPGDVAYIWHNPLLGSTVQNGMEACGFHLRSQIIWAKPHFALGRGDYHWQHESCAYMVKKAATGHWAGDRKQTTIWQIANGTLQGTAREKPEDAKTGHGTQKPVECMKRPIENNSNPGQAVYDPFCGSGTTIISCEMTGRSCRALELNPAYVDVAILRFQNFTGEQATLEATGQTYAEVAEQRVPRA